MKIRLKQYTIFISILFSAISYAEPNHPNCWNDGMVYSFYGGMGNGNPDPTPGGGNNGPPNPPYKKNQDEELEPINMHTGNFTLEKQDLFIRGRGIDFNFTRYYNGQDHYNGPLGYGWSHSYDMQITETIEGDTIKLILRQSNGQRTHFTRQADGSYSTSYGSYNTLKKVNSQYLLYTKEGIIYEFNPGGQLISITDTGGNRISLEYDLDTNLLTTITDTLGRQIIMDYYPETKKLHTITDSKGRIITYEYDTEDNLVRVKTPATSQYPSGLVTTYAYNRHKMISINDPANQTYLVNEYNSFDRVIRQTYGDSVSEVSYDYPNSKTTMFDANGNKTELTFNDNGTISERKVFVENNQTYITKYEYNSNLELTKIIYPRGNTIENRYDGHGNLLQVRRKTANLDDSPDDIVTVFTYEPVFNRIKSVTDPNGNTTAYTYDYQESGDYNSLSVKTGKTEQQIIDLITNAGIQMNLGDINGDGLTNQESGNIIKIQYPRITMGIPQPQDITRYFSYNQYGQLISAANPLGVITRYDYYASGIQKGYLEQVTLDLGGLNQITRFSYDGTGNIISVTDPVDNTTVFEVNELDKLSKVTLPSPFNYETNIYYDANGNIEKIDRDTGDLLNPWQTTEYQYNQIDKLIRIEDELGNVSTLEYDSNHNLNKTIDNELKTTAYEYDKRNNIRKVINEIGANTEYNYDPNGNIISITDANRNITTYTYDLYDRLEQVTYPDTTTERYAYDKNSNLISFTNRNGHTINYRYDELGRLYHKDYPSGDDITYQYDPASRLDSLSKVSQLIDYSYDRLGRVISVTNEGSKTISYEYHLNGMRKKLTYPDGLGYITYNYDELNRLTDIKKPAGQGIAHYTYNALNLRETMQYLNGITTSYTYDELSRLTAASNQLSTINYTYDTMWNRTSMTNEYGEYRYDYDSIYQLTSVIASGGEAISYNYDPVGNRTAGYTTNNLNQYTAVGTTAYTYDNNGNLTSNGTQTYTYDYENRLTSVIASQGEAISYTYDPFNRRTQKNNNGTITNYLYDGDNLLVEYNQNWEPIRYYAYSDNIDEPITITNTNATYYYHADGLGSITHITDNQGNLIEKYQYDPYGKPIITDAGNQPLAISSVGNIFMFTAREYDAETGLYYYRNRYYDPTIGRFLQTDPVGYLMGANLYTYVNNSPLNWTDPYGLWGEDTHHGRTREWAEDVGYGRGISDAIGRANTGTDTGVPGSTGPWPGGWGDQSRHFDIPLGGIDSRDVHAQQEFDNAVRAWGEGRFNEAIESLGRGLHSLQDKYAHGSWDPSLMFLPDAFAHPPWYDDWDDPRNVWKQELTEQATKEYLERFRKEIRKGKECN